MDIRVGISLMVVGALCASCAGSDPGRAGGGTGAAAQGGGGHAGGEAGTREGGAGGVGGAPAGADAVGAPCGPETTCPAGGSGSPVCLTDWPGGYCAVEGCTQHGHDCPGDPGLGGTATTGSKCVLAPTATCLALCGTDLDCRDGYACVDKSDAAGHGSAKVCFPK